MHIPVLQKEVLKYLDPKPNENFIDCTIGQGGHALAILEKNGPKGKVLGIEWDSEIIQCLKPDVKHLLLEKRLILVCDNFVNLEKIVKKQNFKPVSGILFDLGMSSWHLEQSGRGFSFLRNEPLIMRYNWKSTKSSLLYSSKLSAGFGGNLTAAEIVDFWPEKEIERILKEYGEERFAKKIAREIVREREKKPIKTTFQLGEIIKKAVPKNYERGRIHPATRTFQALRIAVNDELNNLKKALPQALEVLEPGGSLVVISFHSLEARIIKNFLNENSQKGLLKILTKKPIRPSPEEIKVNPRSRSAKLRTAQIL